MAKVKFNEFNNDLGEISQTINIKYAFLTEQNEQTHPFVKCRDFLHDVLYAIHGNRAVGIYGFGYNTKTNPLIDLNNIRLLVTYQNEKQAEEWSKKAINVLNIFEETFDKKSIVEEVEDHKNMRVFIGSREWLSTPALLSLYTLLIRLVAHNLETHVPEINTMDDFIKACKMFVNSGRSSNDRTYINSIHSYLADIIKYRKQLFKEVLQEDGWYSEYFKEVPTHEVHSNRGIVALCYNKYPGIPNVKEMLQKTKEQEPVATPPAENKKKEPLSIRVLKPIDEGYIVPNMISFGLVSSPPERTLCSKLFSCRDYLNDYLSYTIRAGVRLNPYSNSALPPDMAKLRLVMRFTPKKKSNILLAKKILNIIEKELGFAPSKIATCTFSENTMSESKMLVTGPGEWMRYSTTLSFVTYIFKSCYYVDDKEFIEKYSNMSSIDDVLSFYREGISLGVGDPTYNSSYADFFVTHLLQLIKKFNLLFPDAPVEERYPKSYNTHSPWGIMAYLRGQDVENSLLEENRKLHFAKKGERDEN